MSEVEIDILMCRLQAAIWDDNKEKLKEIIEEAKELVIMGENHGK